MDSCGTSGWRAAHGGEAPPHTRDDGCRGEEGLKEEGREKNAGEIDIDMSSGKKKNSSADTHARAKKLHKPNDTRAAGVIRGLNKDEVCTAKEEGLAEEGEDSEEEEGELPFDNKELIIISSFTALEREAM
jgi:hypothetical protein